MPKGLLRPVVGKLYLYTYIYIQARYPSVVLTVTLVCVYGEFVLPHFRDFYCEVPEIILWRYTEFRVAVLTFVENWGQGCWQEMEFSAGLQDVGFGIAQSIQRLTTTCWTVRGPNPGWGEVLRTRPYGPRDPPSFLYDGYRVSFPGVERSGCGVNHLTPPRAEVKERVYLSYTSTSPLGLHGLS
jgi:hypothetical protein